MAEKEYSRRLAQQIEEYLKESKYDYHFGRQSGLFAFPLTIEKPMNSLVCIVDVRRDSFILIARLPIDTEDCDGDTVRRMMEFVCRANTLIPMGSFDFNCDSGSIQYRICSGIHLRSIQSEPFRTYIGLAVANVLRFADGFMRVLFGGAEAKTAIEGRKTLDLPQGIRKCHPPRPHRRLADSLENPLPADAMNLDLPEIDPDPPEDGDDADCEYSEDSLFEGAED